MFKTRLQKLREKLSEEKLDAVLVSSVSNATSIDITVCFVVKYEYGKDSN